MGWRRALIYLPPVVLIVVALAQLTLSHTAGLVPWKGGGFGMFSSVDYEWTRIIRIFLIAGGREYRIVSLPRSDALALELARARALPTADRLGRVSQTLARIPWGVDAAGAASPLATSTAGRARARPDAIRVEVYRLRFDAERRQIVRVQIRTVIREVW